MAAQTFDAIVKSLNAKAYQPVYFLHGEEPYYIDQIASMIEDKVLSQDEKEFNQTILYGRDVNISGVISYARQYPMMSNFQVVIVREAQDIKDMFPQKNKQAGESAGTEDEDEANDSVDEQDVFLSYLKNPQKSTVLVFCYKYKKVDKRTRLGKQLESATVYFESKRVYDDKIHIWIQAYVKSKGYSIPDSAATLLGDYLGTELSKVSNELDKLMINVPAGTMLNTEMIEKSIGISKDFNVFELQKALVKKDFLKINRIVNYFGANPKSNPMVLTLSTLHAFFTKIITYHVYKGKPGVNMSSVLGINSFFLRDYEQAARTFSVKSAIRAIEILHEYDLRSKGVNNLSADEHELLQEMIFRMMHHEPVTA